MKMLSQDTVDLNYIKLALTKKMSNICLHHVTEQLFSVSGDWKTVKNVVPGNSLSKPDQTGTDRKAEMVSKMLNFFIYIRLDNVSNCL